VHYSGRSLVDQKLESELEKIGALALGIGISSPEKTVVRAGSTDAAKETREEEEAAITKMEQACFHPRNSINFRDSIEGLHALLDFKLKEVEAGEDCSAQPSPLRFFPDPSRNRIAEVDKENMEERAPKVPTLVVAPKLGRAINRHSAPVRTQASFSSERGAGEESCDDLVRFSLDNLALDKPGCVNAPIREALEEDTRATEEGEEDLLERTCEKLSELQLHVRQGGPCRMSMQLDAALTGLQQLHAGVNSPLRSAQERLASKLGPITVVRAPPLPLGSASVTPSVVVSAPTVKVVKAGPLPATAAPTRKKAGSREGSPEVPEVDFMPGHTLLLITIYGHLTLESPPCRTSGTQRRSTLDRPGHGGS